MSIPKSESQPSMEGKEVKSISTNNLIDNVTGLQDNATNYVLRKRFPEDRARSVTPASEFSQRGNISDSPEGPKGLNASNLTDNVPSIDITEQSSSSSNTERDTIESNRPGLGLGYNIKIRFPNFVKFISGCLHFKITIFCVLVLFLYGIVNIEKCLSGLDLNEENCANAKSATQQNFWREKQLQFRKVFKKLRKDFPFQSNETFIQIGALIDFSLVETEQKQPSAVTVLIPPRLKSSTFPNCFITKIANVVNRIFLSSRLIDPKILTPKIFSEAESIGAIHDDLKAYFKQGGRAVIIEDVDKIDNEHHLLVFHAFCDNSHAYQKRAIFFFLLHVPEDIFEKFEWTFQRRSDISYLLLDKAWSTVLTPDKRPAFIARVDGTTVLLNEGDTC